MARGRARRGDDGAGGGAGAGGAAGAGAPERRPLLGGGALGLFSEALLVGLGVSVLALPVVTLVPALAAGCAHVRRHVHAEPDGLADLGRDFLAALRGVWAVALGATVALGLLWLDLGLALSGALPGGPAVAAVSAVVALGLVVVLLRAAGAWRPGARWPATLRTGAALAAEDRAGSALLVLALAMCALFTWMLAPLAVLVPGLLALAVVAVELRPRTTR